MRKGFALTLATVGVAACLGIYALNSNSASPLVLKSMEATDADEQAFIRYIAKFRKSYGTKEEYEFRLQVFKENLALISEHNQQNSESWQDVNMFSDWSEEEYQQLLGYKPSTDLEFEDVETLEYDENLTVPSSVDWRKHGAVTNVKNQGSCGSCWSFSSTGAMEGAHAIQTGSLVSLSEQQFVDCSTQNHGCNGGSMALAFRFAESNPIEKESQYPYRARQSSCHQSYGAVKVTSYQNVGRNSVSALKQAVSKGPVSVAIEADRRAFQGYSGGVLNSSACGTNLDHGVLVVGYNINAGTPYWIVKNSWGPAWGESGYIRIAMQNGAGICGIQMQPVKPYTN